ncbi:autoinducer synthase [Roseovarius sp. SCSIO 43702]|uniref:acyl-homoserine-lactone synthase n=1 Tax=Roseovarius sp. SCSIO 43702 TaxID=2823043 RepID=UPI001C736F45|nr:acyl-homoserine-lactone synthase [Roseovarius sp. SCSIO 43702]QYX57220.1 autoinducer synthase [Roseovarius sp. SCSIO 43702]
MLRFIQGRDLHHHPALARAMFRDRARQFHERLGWEVRVDAAGEERDQYDPLDPLYVIWEPHPGEHGGSMRLMPTTGRTMINEHFAHLLPRGALRDPRIWECTRFCLAPGASARVPALLMLAGGEVIRGFGLTHYVGVFDAAMIRIYRLIGASPQVIGHAGEGRARISAGLWDSPDDARARVARRAGISPELAAHWLRRSGVLPCEERRSA